MKMGKLFDKNHLIGFTIFLITMGSFWAISSRGLIEAVFLPAAGLTLLGLLFVLYFIRSVIAVPLSPITVFVGYQYGFPLGVGIGIAGGTLSCLLPYFLGRYIRTPVGIIGGFSKRTDTFVEIAGSLRSVLAARVSPVPTDVVSYGAGLSNIHFSNYLIGTMIGLIPWTFSLVLLGDSLQQFTLDEVSVSIQLIGSMILITILILSPAVYRWMDDSIIGRG